VSSSSKSEVVVNDKEDKDKKEEDYPYTDKATYPYMDKTTTNNAAKAKMTSFPPEPQLFSDH
jgi:hypothetical protein